MGGKRKKMKEKEGLRVIMPDVRRQSESRDTPDVGRTGAQLVSHDLRPGLTFKSVDAERLKKKKKREGGKDTVVSKSAEIVQRRKVRSGVGQKSSRGGFRESDLPLEPHL